MNMGIFTRIGDILQANINDLIDKAEDPEKLVKQLIIEMDNQVDDATKALGQAMGSQKVAAMELADAKAAAADWNDKAKLALKAGNEALAKKALDAKVGVDQQVASLQANYDQITANVDALKQQVEQLKMKLDEARSRQQVLVARSRMADAAQKTAVTITSATTDSAFAKLDALERKIAENSSSMRLPSTTSSPPSRPSSGSTSPEPRTHPGGAPDAPRLVLLLCKHLP